MRGIQCKFIRNRRLCLRRPYPYPSRDGPVPVAGIILGRDVLLSLTAFYIRYTSLPPPVGDLSARPIRHVTIYLRKRSLDIGISPSHRRRCARL